MIVDGIAEPMELGHLPYKKATLRTTLDSRTGKATARKNGGIMSPIAVKRLVAALEPDDVVARRRQRPEA